MDTRVSSSVHRVTFFSASCTPDRESMITTAATGEDEANHAFTATSRIIRAQDAPSPAAAPNKCISFVFVSVPSRFTQVAPPYSPLEARIISFQAFYDSNFIRQPRRRKENWLFRPHEAGGHPYSREPRRAHRSSCLFRQGNRSQHPC